MMNILPERTHVRSHQVSPIPAADPIQHALVGVQLRLSELDHRRQLRR